MPAPEEMSREELIVLVGEQARQIRTLSATNEDLVAKLAKLEHLLQSQLRQFLDAPVQEQRSGTDAAVGQAETARRRIGTQAGQAARCSGREPSLG